MQPSQLTILDFELAYLVLLTGYGLKPLSRWERDLREEQRDVIRSTGLVLRPVQRRTRIGRRRTEIVFARDSRRTSLYHQRFDGSRLRLTPDVIRTEGRLFGYPACCVEAFIREPYGPNELTRDEQSILFHWACRGCLTTPALLREYRRVHAECRRLFGRSSPVAIPPGARQPSLAKAAALLALIAGSAGLAAADDPHWLPVPDDADQDYLSVAEEIVRGTEWGNPDCDGDQVLDGVQTALLLRQLIAAPPSGVVVTDYPMWGIETCSICGETVNMGYVEITHTLRGLTVELPYIALHYLEHGSLSYDGDLHTGRADLHALKQILCACDPAHLLPVPGEDPDEDGLHSEEEPVLGTDPQEADSDGDSLIDGPQIAEELVPIIGDLPREVVPDRPYLQEYWLYGLEQCSVCGLTVNMGGVEICNPIEGLSVIVPFVALHAVGHGSFVYDGTVNQGHVVPSVLKTAIAGDGSAHWLPVPGDGDGDGLADGEEPFFGLDPDNPDEDQNGVPDGRDLAVQLAAQIHDLPEGPLPDQIHLIHYPTYGVYNCVTCGEEINMGYCEVVNPLLGSSVEVPYYTLHFMDRGSFSTDRADLYPRIDPRLIGQVLGMEGSGLEPADDATSFAFYAAPNPIRAGEETKILLAFPGVVSDIDVGIYDGAGRRICDLYTGGAPRRATQLTWAGRDSDGGALPAGVYFCRIAVGAMTVSRKLVVIE